MTEATIRSKPLVEQRSIDWVPEDERHGKLWHQGPLWFLGNFQYFSIPIGFIGPAMGLSLGWSILAAVLGIVIGTTFMALHASQGPVLGLPQMIQSRAQFGFRGVLIPLVVTLFTYLAFNVTDEVLLGSGLHASFGWNADLIAVVTALAAAALAILGHDWLHKVFRSILWIALPLMSILTVGVLLGQAGGSAPSVSLGFNLTAFIAQLSAAAAYNITYAPYVSDYSRYLPRTTPPGKVIASVFFGASGSAIWLIALGSWLAVRLGATDGLAGLRQAGNNVIPHLGDACAIVSSLALLATMGMNAYGGMLTVLTGIDSVRPINPTQKHRVVTILGLMIVWFAIARAIPQDAISTVTTALTLMLYLLVPWTAVNLVDFFLVRRGHYDVPELFRPDGVYGVWSAAGLGAFTVGLLSEVPFMVLPDLGALSFTGPAARMLDGADVAWGVGLVVTALLYWWLRRDDRSSQSLTSITQEASV